MASALALATTLALSSVGSLLCAQSALSQAAPPPDGEPCAEGDTLVGAVQGSGESAAVAGEVTVQGVVVGDEEGPSPRLRGFYLQGAADGDSATSDGIFVFDEGSDLVALGDEVQVTGEVGELHGQTQIARITRLEYCASGGQVEPTPLELPAPSASFFERYEGMLVHFAQPLVVTDLHQLGRFGQLTLSAQARLVAPTQVARPGAPAQAVRSANERARIIVDDDLQNQNPDPIPFARHGQPLRAGNTLRAGDTVTGLRGVLTHTWAGHAASLSAYRVRPLNALGTAPPVFHPHNPRPTELPEVGGSLRLLSFNLQNFFNSFGAGSCGRGYGGDAADCRGASDADELTRQAAKLVSAIVAVDADVLAVLELENDGYGPASALAELVQRVNAALGSEAYAYVDFDTQTGHSNAAGRDAIKSGLIYKPASVSALPGAAFADRDPIHERAPLAQTFRSAAGARFAVIVSHFKAKRCSGATGRDADQGDGQGCFNARRVEQARALLRFADHVAESSAVADVLLLGDLNAYAEEAPIGVLETGGFANLVARLGGAEPYSYGFEGQWGYLDHAFASDSLAGQVTGVRQLHINADEPSTFDYQLEYKPEGQRGTLYASDMYRSSDHDPLLIGLALRSPRAVPVSGVRELLALSLLCALAFGRAGRRAARRGRPPT